MADPIPVRFLKPEPPYNTGEVAWFAPLQAAVFIKTGTAERATDVGEYVPAPTRYGRLQRPQRAR